MSTFATFAYAFLRNILARQEGQDLVEYALVMTMIALGSVSGMGFLANGIDTTFSVVGTTLTANV